MRILLVNPPINHVVSSDFSSKLLSSGFVPPLGLMYLASYAKGFGHDVQILDMAFDNALKMKIMTYNPDIIGITSTTLTLYDAIATAKAVKKVGNIPVMIGGAHCDIYPKETASFDCIDYVVRGDGWKPLLRVLNNEQKSKICEVDPLEDFNSVPFPDRRMVDIEKYHSAISKGKLMTTMISSLGCPYSCIFCHQPHYKKWRARSAINVVNEMMEISRMGISEIEIYDDTFTYDRHRVIEICNMLSVLKLKVDWNIRTRVDRVDPILLQFMAKAGCKRINYGIESVTPSVLKTLRKGFGLEQIKDAIRWTREAGIEMQAYFMLGSPGETKEQMLDTIKFANKYIDDYAFYSITQVLPGTDLCKNDFWTEFARNPIPGLALPLWNETDHKELEELLDYAYRSFYLRPGYILKQFMKVKSAEEFVRKASMAIKMFN